MRSSVCGRCWEAVGMNKKSLKEHGMVGWNDLKLQK